jgi:pilus assembly protein Flp/PilA
MKKLLAFFKEDEGAGLVEYALLVAVIAVATIGVMVTLQGGIETTFTNANTELTKPY